MFNKQAILTGFREALTEAAIILDKDIDAMSGEDAKNALRTLRNIAKEALNSEGEGIGAADNAAREAAQDEGKPQE